MTPRSPLFRLLLRLYPRAYQERYGAEMESFEREERAAGAGGVIYGMRLTVDHVRAAAAVRRGRGDGTMRRLMEDLAGGFRALRRAPTFTTFAVLTLALGVSATTAVFSVLDRVVLRPLPYPGAERLVRIGIDPRHDPGSLGPLSGALMLRLQDASGPAEAVVGASVAGVILSDGGEPARAQLTRVTRGFFEFFGARPAAGRLPGDADYAPGAERVLVLGHAFWRERYGADPEVVGRTVRLSDETYTVVGVLARDFVPPPEIVEERDLWTALPLDGETASRGTFYLGGIARLRPGASLEELDAHADRVVEDLYPGGDGPNFLAGGSVADYRTDVLGAIGSTLARVLAAAGILLLIACVNVASLLLTRGAERARELAVRVALGAGRRRLVRQLLAESALIALAGGALGSALAWGAVELFRAYAPAGLPRLEEVAVDGRGLAFCLVLAGATVMLFGLLPALRSTAGAVPGDALARRSTGSRREGRLRSGLIVIETALAVVVAVGSALLAHDLVRLAREDAGFSSAGLVTARVDLAPRFQREEWADVWARVLEGARALPGVTSAAVATQAPYAGTRMATMVRPEGPDEAEGEFVVQTSVAGDYVRTLGARVLEGRALTEVDDGTEPVVVVSESFARRYWPGEAAVGKLVRSGGEGVDDESTWTVVGVLADVRTDAGEDVWPQIYLPLREKPWRDMEIILRTEGDPTGLAPALRALVHRVDATLPVTRIATVESLAAEGRARPRFYTGLFGGFAAVALLLALVGVYGTTAYATRARTREIGIRMALGAMRVSVVGSMVAHTGATLALGTAIGLAGAALASRAMADVLIYVTPRDVAAYAAVAGVVLMAGLLASWIPAERAGRVDPVQTLREE